MNRTAIILGFMSIALALAVVLVGFKIGNGPMGAPAGPDAWTPEQQRALAGKLKGAGLTLQAIQAYEDYARSAPLTKSQRANLAYTIGKLYMESGRYEAALSWFYRVELADPETGLKADVGPKIISCLERTGKYNAAEYALSRRASQQQPDEPAGTKVVAEIGKEKIYLESINDALDSLPEWMRRQFEGEQGKAEFLKKYVADELLFRKAVKLELDKDPQVRKQLKKLEKELLVNRVLEAELKDKITMEEEDLKNFFKAHAENYLQKEAVRLSLIKAGMKEIAESIVKKLKGGKPFGDLAREVSLDNATAKNGGRFGGWVRKGTDDLGIGNVQAVSEAIFSTPRGGLSAPVEAGGYYYIFKIDETRPEKMPSFEQARERVQNDYYVQKLKISYQGLLDQILKSAEVKIYPEAVTGGDAS